MGLQLTLVPSQKGTFFMSETITKVGLASLIKEIKAGDYQPPCLGTDDQAQAELLWKNTKPDRGANLYVLIDPIISQVYRDRRLMPPYGLKYFQGEPVQRDDLKNSHDPFNIIRLSMKATLLDALNQTLSSIKQPNPARPTSLEQQNAYHQIDQMVAFWFRQVLKKDLPENATDELIAIGIDPPCELMPATFEVIPHVFAREYPAMAPSAELFTRIANNSLPFVSFFTKQHIYTSMIQFGLLSQESIGPYRFNPNSLTLEATPSGPRLAIQEVIKKELATRGNQLPDSLLDSGLIMGMTSPIATGCPLAVAIDGLSGVQLWNWNIEIGQQIYQMQGY